MTYKTYIVSIVIVSLIILGMSISGINESTDVNELEEAYRLLNAIRPKLVQEYRVINVTKYEYLSYNPLPEYNFVLGEQGSWSVVKGVAVPDAELPDSLRINADRATWSKALKIQGDSNGFLMYSSLDVWKDVLAGAPLMVYGIASSHSLTGVSDVNVGIEYSTGGGGCPILFVNSSGLEPVTNMLVNPNEVIIVQRPVEKGTVSLVIKETGDSIVTLKSLKLYILPELQASGYLVVQSGDYKKAYLVKEDSLMTPQVIDVMGNKLQLHVENMDQFYAILQPKDPILVVIDRASVKNGKLLLVVKFSDPGYYVKSTLSIKVLGESGFIEVSRISGRIITGLTYGFEVPLDKPYDGNVVLVLIESSTMHYIDYVGFTSDYKLLSVASLSKGRLVYAELNGREIGGPGDIVVNTNGTLKLVFNVDTEGYPVIIASGKVNRVGDTVVRITRDYTMIGSVILRHKTSHVPDILASSSEPVWSTISSPIVYLPGNPDSINYIRLLVEAPAYSERYLAYLKILLEPIAITTGYNEGTYPYDLISTGLVGFYNVEKMPTETYRIEFVAVYQRYALFGGHPGQLFDVIDKQNIILGWFTSWSSDEQIHMDFNGLVFYFNDENLDASSGGYSSIADTIAALAEATGTILTVVSFKIPSPPKYLTYASLASDAIGYISGMIVDDNGPPVYITPLLPGDNIKYTYMVLDYSGDVSYTVLSEKSIEVKFSANDLPVYSFIIFNRENPVEYGDFDWEDPDSIIIWLNFYR